MNYFTSDLHIGHDKDFIWKARGFNSIEEHDTQILINWNTVVTPEDTVFILGDLCMSGNKEEWNRIYKNLNGNKVMITGNHDTISKIIKYTTDYNIINYGLSMYYKYSKKKNFYLCHYPTFVDNYTSDKFFWCLAGHTHSKDPFEYGKHCVYNVAVDAHNCTPVSIETIIKDIEKYKFLNKQVETEKHYWKIIANGRYATCSNCGKSFLDVYDFDNYDNYCRHCGVKMEGIKS